MRAWGQEPPKPDSTRRPQALPTIITTAPRPEREQFEAAPNTGVISITGRELTQAPRFFGESDVLRAARLLPGVAARNDYSVGMNVRGGEADQNLVLLDGYPIYNPFHMGGLFGAFVEPMVDRVEFFTGAFPALYGGRLSSVLDVRSRVEPRQGVHGSANLSMVASTLALGSTTRDTATSWLVAVRRTYADKVIDLFYDNVVPYHFRDAQVHVTHRLSPTTQVEATAYDNIDHLADTPLYDDPFHVSWGNRLVGVTLARAWTPERILTRFDSLRAEQKLSASTFNMRMDLLQGGLRADNRVKDYRYSSALTGYSYRRRRTVGVELQAQSYDFAANYGIVLYPADTLSSDNGTAGVYYDDLWRLNDKWIVQAGARVDAVHNAGPPLFQPRLSVKYFLTRDMAVTGAFGTFAQWAHSLAREDVPIRALDFWAGSDSRATVSRARHYVVGLERWFTRSKAVRIEGFFKQYPSLVEQNRLSDPVVPGDEFSPLHGYSFGGDMMLRKFEDGGWNGWLAYSFAKSTRIDADGTSFRPGQDRRHEINLVASRTGARWTKSFRFNFATGTPYTRILASYYGRTYDPTTGVFQRREDPSLLTGPRNAEQLPGASRLDVSFTRNGHDARVSPFISILNLYNARNAFAYIDDWTADPPTRYPLPQFPVFPTIGVAIVW